MIKNIKGTKDILPNETDLWQYVELKIHHFFKKYGYKEIRTPSFEDSALFHRSIGEETDIVSKEMYSWIDQGGKSLTLKPEVTASVVRAFNQHNLGHENKINKLYYIDSLFRRERPQKGRYRQFQQFGIETMGSDRPEQDAEIIAMAHNLYKFLKIDGIVIKLNSIGSSDSRIKYKKALGDYLKKYENDLSDLSKKRLQTNPLRILDTKINSEIDIIKQAPKITDYLDSEDKQHYDKVREYLNELEIKFIEDPLLVRGLDYYSRTVFEIHSDSLGSQNALCGGGRYDCLIEELGGKSTPAIGFAAGIERLILALDKEKHDYMQNPYIYFVALGEKAIKCSLKIIDDLRMKNDLAVVTDSLNRNLKAQMKEANKLNVSYSIILGENELKDNKLIIKNMSTGNQEEIAIDELSFFFKNNIK